MFPKEATLPEASLLSILRTLQPSMHSMPVHSQGFPSPVRPTPRSPSRRRSRRSPSLHVSACAERSSAGASPFNQRLLKREFRTYINLHYIYIYIYCVIPPSSLHLFGQRSLCKRNATRAELWHLMPCKDLKSSGGISFDPSPPHSVVVGLDGGNTKEEH